MPENGLFSCTPFSLRLLVRFGRCDLYADDEDMSTFSQCLCEIFCKTFHNLCAYALLELVVGGTL